MRLKNSGFTIIELLIALTLSVVIFATAMQLLVVYLRQRGSTIAQSEVNQNIRTVLTVLEKNIHSAYAINTLTGNCANPCILTLAMTSAAVGQGCFEHNDITCFTLDDDLKSLEIQPGTSTGNIRALTSSSVTVTSFSATITSNTNTIISSLPGFLPKRSVKITFNIKYAGPEQTPYQQTVQSTYAIH